MPKNDKDFKAALGALPIAHQRHVAAQFVLRVLPLSNDFRLKAAIELAQRPDISDAELTSAYQSANTARVESFTRCGKETDWTAQAGHFVAKAAVACVRPATEGENLAWEAAMSARMARTCETVATGEGTENSEAQEQYSILGAFLNR
jgi:3'-phosphoadenosine 5'-phosphosulfate (PAPS) 3'-phosphatase